MDTLPAESAKADVSQERLAPSSRRLRLTLTLTGFPAGADVAVKLERALEQLPGVIHAYVNSVTEMAYIEYDPGLTGEQDLSEAIGSVGLWALITATTGAPDAE